ncbi:MAG TPA: DNA polymerase III subunit epsilon [Lachnospiraceae bacterium]|nr:DNA polymerase III subunit epsilon [Lachnospiraceae bacterium]
MNEYVAVDLETTELTPKTDRILEIGAYRVVRGEFAEKFHMMLDPGIAVPPRITELTGITQEMVRGQAQQKDGIRAFIDFAGELPLLGHNLIFDYGFLKHAAVNAGYSFEKEGADTLKISREVLPQLASRSLGALCVHFSIGQQKAHRGDDDARVTALLYEELKKRYGERNPDLFVPRPLIYKAKRQSPITNAQKGYLNDLVKYHKIKLDVQIENLTKGEASRLIDRILTEHGKIRRSGF